MPKNMTLRTAALLLIVSVAFPGFAGKDDLVVIVNKANSTSKLSKGDLRALYLTTKTSWSDGSPVLALNLPESSEPRQQFDQAVLGMDSDEVAKYWTDRRLRGGTRAPKKVLSTRTVVKAVTESAGAVGYVRRSEASSTVKIVAEIRGTTVAGAQ